MALAPSSPKVSRADERAWLAVVSNRPALRRLAEALRAAPSTPAVDEARDHVGCMPPGEWLAGELARLLGPTWLPVATSAAGDVVQLRPKRRPNAGERRRSPKAVALDSDDQGDSDDQHDGASS